MLIYVWTRFEKGIWLPTNRVKAKIGFLGLLSRAKVSMKDDILGIISNYFEVHIMSKMFGDTNLATIFFSAMRREIRVIYLVIYWLKKRKRNNVLMSEVEPVDLMIGVPLIPSSYVWFKMNRTYTRDRSHT